MGVNVIQSSSNAGKRVMFVSTSLNMGGAETQVFLLATTFVALGWSVAVVSMIEPKYFSRELEEQGVKFYSLGMKPGMANPKAIFRLLRIYRTWRPSIVHSHMYHANILCRFARIFSPNIPLVSTAHSINETDGSRLRLFLYKVTRYLSSHMTNVSEAAFNHYVDMGIINPAHGSYMPNGVNTKSFAYDPSIRSSMRQQFDIDRNFVWLAIGRFVKAKDYPNLIAALDIVRNEGGSNFIVLMVGDGPLFQDIVDLVNERGLQEYVRFLGVRKDIPQLMSAIDGFVMSSAWEGLPMVLLEALACERSVVATDVGGIRELSREIGDGNLVPSSNPKALAVAMAKVMQTSLADRSNQGSSAREKILLRYGIIQIAKAWEELYGRFIR